MAEQERHEPAAERREGDSPAVAGGLQGDNRGKQLGGLEGYSLETLCAFFDA